MILNSTTEKIEIILSGNVSQFQADFLSSYAVFQESSMSIEELNGVTNNSTAVTIMDSPSANTQRQLRDFSLTNLDTSSGITVVVRYNDNNKHIVMFLELF